MKQVVLFGAGKSATVLIEYLLQNAEEQGCHLTVADGNLEAAQQKLGNSAHGTAVSLDIVNDADRTSLIQNADIVISLMPPSLHFLIAKDCVHYHKPLLTASYVDEQMRSLQKDIEDSGLLFLCEMGLDPGIDHMSLKKMIDEIHADGGEILSIFSHCGGLVAPESDDNPWHYKISWNPANVVTAGQAGAVFKMNGKIHELEYKELFATKKYATISGHETLCWYPNRDSLRYISLYGLENNCDTFIRTTLRHPDFIYGWQNLIETKLTERTQTYNTDGKSLSQLLKEHMDRIGFSEWLAQKLRNQIDSTKELLNKLASLAELEKTAEEKGAKRMEEFMVVDDSGDLHKVDIDDLKLTAAATLAEQMHDASLTLKQLFYLGLDDSTTLVNKGRCSAADILQFALEKKLSLQPGDRDMVIMQHEIEFKKRGDTYLHVSTLLLKGDDDIHTAMAKSVGLPLGIAAKMVLNGSLALKGLHIPVLREIYNPVLEELRLHGITFNEKIEMRP